jgi:hypothetical protein
MTKTLTDGCEKVSMYRRTSRVKQPNRDTDPPSMTRGDTVGKEESLVRGNDLPVLDHRVFTREIVLFDDTSNVTVLSDNVFTKIWNRPVSSTSLRSVNKCLSNSFSLKFPPSPPLPVCQKFHPSWSLCLPNG